ncbi:MAG: polymer-forming cytoskeletal protein [Alphaproteobacteria bacterium]|nr:polymer-forming cytoskeletal protein [Alphaproteobacteria bacterium]
MLNKAKEITPAVVPPGVKPALRPQRPGVDQKRPSILSSNLHLTGDLRSEGDVHLEGAVNGSIFCKGLTIADGAKIDGNITCKSLDLSQDGGIQGDIHGDEVRVSGRVHGNITARVVHLNSTAKVAGNIVHESLSVEAGAHLMGECRHTDEVATLVEKAVEELKKGTVMPKREISHEKHAKVS